MNKGVIVEKNVTKVDYDGKIWHLSKTANYFYAHFSNDGKRKYVGLHRYIYEKYSGKTILNSNDVHHEDHDFRNNLFTNLIEIDSTKHHSYHLKALWKNNRSRMVKATKAGRDASKEWHKSTDGKEWHRKHAIKMWKNRESFEKTKNCLFCNKKYTTYRSDAKYCSNKCSQKNNYKNKKFIISCLFCGKKSSKKDSRIRYCSKSCAHRKDARRIVY